MRWWVKSILVGLLAAGLSVGVGIVTGVLFPALGWEVPSILALALVSLGFLIGALSGTVAGTAPPASFYQPEHHPEVNAMSFSKEMEHLGPGRWNPDMLLAGVIPLITALGIILYLLILS